MALRKVGEKALLAAEKHESKVPKTKQQTILNEDKYAEVRHNFRMSFIIAHQQFIFVIIRSQFATYRHCKHFIYILAFLRLVSFSAKPPYIGCQPTSYHAKEKSIPFSKSGGVLIVFKATPSTHAHTQQNSCDSQRMGCLD